VRAGEDEGEVGEVEGEEGGLGEQVQEDLFAAVAD
jgi:hypothetical protein